MPNGPSPSLRRLLPPIAIAVAAAGAGLWLASRDEPPASSVPPGATAPEGAAGARSDEEARAEARALETLQATLRRSQVLPSDFRTVPPFTLADVDGEPLTETVLDGHWSILFFGYTNCPDVCPVTLSVMKSVVAELERRGAEPMQVLFVSVDPVRDTPARMKEYVAFFDERFIGVSGERNAVHELTRELGIVAAFSADDTHPEAYTVDHTASMLLVDPQRRVRAKFTAPHELDTIVADYVAIRGALN